MIKHSVNFQVNSETLSQVRMRRRWSNPVRHGACIESGRKPKSRREILSSLNVGINGLRDRRGRKHTRR
jgi:hypothetical protein